MKIEKIENGFVVEYRPVYTSRSTKKHIISNLAELISFINDYYTQEEACKPGQIVGIRDHP